MVYITAAETQEKFTAAFRGMPWLSLPFTHALRREQLRHLFEARRLAMLSWNPFTTPILVYAPEPGHPR